MGRRPSRFHETIRSTVVVHTKGGQSIRGVLLGVYEDCISLTHAKMLSAEGSVPLDGEVLIRHEEISLTQVGARFSEVAE